MPPSLLLECRGLSPPAFQAGAPLFEPVSCQLHTNEVLCLEAPSGTGKSVLLKCIANLLIASSGDVRLNDVSVVDMSAEVWRSKVLYLPQRPPLLSGTPLDFEQAVSALRVRKKASAELQWTAADVLKQWTMDLRLLDQPWTQLSGGEAQRCALAVALALRPDVLLLDGALIWEDARNSLSASTTEPTSALDAESAHLVEETLLGRDRLGHKFSCIWVS
jgi:ABC-type iron transport system FetAB ATPase subunit